MKKKEQHHQTDLKLLEAFKLILQKNSKYDHRLSVDNICKEANVHHQTFYQHFSSKEEFYTFSIKYILGKYTIQLDNSSNKLLSFLELFAESFNQHRMFYYHLTKDEILNNIFSNQLKIIFTKILATEYPKMPNDELIFLQGGLIATIIHYLSGQSINEKLLKDTLISLLDRIHKNYLNEFN